MERSNSNPPAGEHLRREAWRRVRPWAHLTAGILVASFLYLWWILGTRVFIFISLLLLLGMIADEAFRRTKAVRRTFVAGAEAEELVGQRLHALAVRGWRHLNNVSKLDGGDVDHVLWGPRGIFVIETKSIRGTVAVESGRLTFGRYMPEKDFVQQTYRNTLLVRDHLTRELERRTWVVGVLCLTDAFIDKYRIDIERPPVHIVKVERLMKLVEQYGDTSPLNEATIQRVTAAMESPLCS